MSVEKTQEIFEKIIQKPQLTTQLLSRPPFKFIVDIVSNVIKSTGYLKNEFPEDEIKTAGDDKNTKTAFLEKLINILDDGSLKNVKAAKIISGKDAEETNRMLQKLGTNASTFSLSNGSSGEGKKKKKIKKEDKGAEESLSTKKRSSKKDSHTEEKLEKKEKEKTKSSEEKKKKSSSSSSKERSKSSEKKEKKKTDVAKSKTKKSDPNGKLLKRQDSMIAVNGDAPDTPTNENDNPQDEGYDDREVSEPTILTNLENDSSAQSLIVQPVASPTDDSGNGDSPRLIRLEDKPTLQRPMTGAPGGRPMTSMGRPGTAASRPAPPKLKKKQIAAVDSAPQTIIELKSEIISDSITKLNLEDDNNFIMENEEEDGERTARISDLVDEEDRGALVQKIMETKAEIEDGVALDQELISESDKVISVEKEKIRQLQEKLQDLTRSAYPLARLFDFANDDIESMIKELERWRSEQRRNEQEEQNKKSSGYGDSSRLYNIIGNLQKEINDMKEELSKARGRVLNNEKRIQLFISNV